MIVVLEDNAVEISDLLRNSFVFKIPFSRKVIYLAILPTENLDQEEAAYVSFHSRLCSRGVNNFTIKKGEDGKVHIMSSNNPMEDTETPIDKFKALWEQFGVGGYRVADAILNWIKSRKLPDEYERVN